MPNYLPITSIDMFAIQILAAGAQPEISEATGGKFPGMKNQHVSDQGSRASSMVRSPRCAPGRTLTRDDGWRIQTTMLKGARLEQWQSFLCSPDHAAKSLRGRGQVRLSYPHAERLALVTACFSQMAVAVRIHPMPAEPDFRIHWEAVRCLWRPAGFQEVCQMLLDLRKSATQQAVISKRNPVGPARAWITASAAPCPPSGTR